MRSVLLTTIILISLSSMAEVNRRSLYYQSDAIVPTKESAIILDSIKDLIKDGRAELVEINAFADIDREDDYCITLSRRRILFVLEELDATGGTILKNPYGKNKTIIDFEVQSWNRVDIYYSVIDLGDYGIIKKKKKDKRGITKIPRYDIKVPNKNKIVMGEPVLLAIEFIGGSTDIKPESMKYLRLLYKTLDTYEDLTIHIRGHVCCERKPIKSRKRAKKVYRYLVDSGIDKSRLSFRGYSNRDPIIWPERSKSDRQTNRRVDVIFSSVHDKHLD